MSSSVANILSLDMGGVVYKGHRMTLAMYPETMLARLVYAAWTGDTPPAEPIKYLLNWYRSGSITLPRSITIEAMRADAEYF